MKGELSGVVGPVFAGVPIPSVRASSPAWRGSAVADAGESSLSPWSLM